MSRAFVRHEAPRNPVELLMNERNQSLEGVGVALAPFEKQSGDVRLTLRDTAILGSFRRLNLWPRFSLLAPMEPRATFERRINTSTPCGIWTPI